MHAQESNQNKKLGSSSNFQHAQAFLLLSFIFIILFVAIFGTPRHLVDAQAIVLPAEINKRFSPISIMPGQISRLSITIYNPNPFQ